MKKDKPKKKPKIKVSKSGLKAAKEIAEFRFDKGFKMPAFYDEYPPQRPSMPKHLPEVLQILGKVYPQYRVEFMPNPMGDYIELRAGNRHARITNTFLASATVVDQAKEIARILQLDEPRYYEEKGEWDKEALGKILELQVPEPKVKKDFADEWYEKNKDSF